MSIFGVLFIFQTLCSAFLTLCILSHQLQSWFAATKLSIAVIQHRAIKHNSTLLYWSMDIKNTSNYILNERSSSDLTRNLEINYTGLEHDEKWWIIKRLIFLKFYRRKKCHKPFLCKVGSCVLKILSFTIFTILRFLIVIIFLNYNWFVDEFLRIVEKSRQRKNTTAKNFLLDNYFKFFGVWVF